MTTRGGNEAQPNNQTDAFMKKVGTRAYYRSLRKAGEVTNSTDANHVQAEEEERFKEEIIGEVQAKINKSIKNVKAAKKATGELAKEAGYNKNCTISAKYETLLSKSKAEEAKEKAEEFAKRAEAAEARAQGIFKKINDVAELQSQVKEENTSKVAEEKIETIQEEPEEINHPSEAEAFKKRVSDRAYFMFENRNKAQGRVIHGYDTQDWHEAERIEKALLEKKTEKSEKTKETTSTIDTQETIKETEIEENNKFGNETVWQNADRLGKVIRQGDPFNRELQDNWDAADRIGLVVESGDLLERMFREGKLKKLDENGKEIKPIKDEVKQQPEIKNTPAEPAPTEPKTASPENPSKPKTEAELIKEYEALVKRAQEIAQELNKGKKEQGNQAENPKNEAETEEEKLKRKTAKAAECAKIIKDAEDKARVEGENKGKADGIKEGEKNGRQALWNQLNEKISLWKKIKILFGRPKTDVEEYLKNRYRTVFVGGIIGIIAGIAGVGVAQYLGYPLAVPITHLNEVAIDKLGRTTFK